MTSLFNECVGDKLTLGEIDDRCGSAILVLPKEMAVEVLQEFVTKKSRVRNPVAFLMGMLKSKRGDIPEGEPIAVKS